ncbi:hypothetical protein ABZ714_24940 [Streptomyces sp. NPDC006798]|uniref:hypothetical protein n=1 Tax=Streptomyces sp. NPDC006798 TaxID=3155462 RepID=UPI0033CC8C0A
MQPQSPPSPEQPGSNSVPPEPFGPPPVPPGPSYGPPAPAPPDPPRRDKGPLIVAALAGLLIGAGAVGGVWAVAGDEADGGSGRAGSPTAKDDARAACEALAGVDESALIPKKSGDSQAPMLRFSAAYASSGAAADRDRAHQPLHDAIRKAQAIIAGRFALDDEAKGHLKTARGICDKL